MADLLSKIFPTEEDRVNCPFYFKIGACRNGDRCNRAHQRPTNSQTVVLPHLYPNTDDSLSVANDEDWEEEAYMRQQEHVETFYEEVFLELSNYGEIEDLVVLDNVSDHMLGNVYCKYYHENSAERAVQKLPTRFYGGKLIQVEFSPVTDFREARCRAFHETRCARGGLCNFMHIKHIPKAVKRRLVRKMYQEHPEYSTSTFGKGGGKGGAAPRSRSRNPPKVAAIQDGASGKKKRMTSEERRAMIAEWNKEEESQVVLAST